MLKSKEKVPETSNMKIRLTPMDLDQFKRHQEEHQLEQEVVYRDLLSKTKVNLRLFKKEHPFDLAHNMIAPNIKDQLLEVISENKTSCRIDKGPKRT